MAWFKAWPKRWLVAVVMCGITQQASALDLMEVYALAKDNDSEYARALSEYHTGKLGADVARAAIKPAFELGASKQRHHLETTPLSSNTREQEYDSERWGVSASQVLFSRSAWASARQGALGAEMAELGFAQQSQALILRTAEVYFDYLLAREVLASALSAKLAFDEQHELADQRLEVGLGTITDRFDAQARASLAQANVITADNALINAQQRLELMIGRALAEDEVFLQLPEPPSAEQDVLNEGDSAVAEATVIAVEADNINDQEKAQDAAAENTNIEPKTQTLDYWLEHANNHSQSRKLAELSYQQAKLALKQAAGARWPSLRLVGNYGWSDTGATLSTPEAESENWEVGLSLAMPLYQGGALRAQKKQAQHQLLAAEADHRHIQRNSDRQVTTAYGNLQAASRQELALAQAVMASDSALSAKQEGFDAGITTNLEVLNAQSALYSARNDYLRARYQKILAELRLSQTAGVLSDADLAAVNARLSE